MGVRHAEVVADDDAPWPLEARPGFLARRLHQIHVGLFAEICAPFRVTPLQYSVMSALLERGNLDQTALAAAVALDRTTTTGILKRLQARGLVARLPSTRDRRAQDCSLTPAGRDLCTAMEAAAREAHAATVAVLAPAEQALLVGLLGRVVAAHDAAGEGRRTDPGLSG
ncbi:MarR family winged helix-turn-helix transcriptional regulator [Methylobacterium sp. JK268]